MLIPARLFLILVTTLAAATLAALPWAVDSPRRLFGSLISVLSPGVFPAVAALGILVFSMIEWLRRPRDGEAEESLFQASLEGRGMVVIILLVVLSALSFDSLGYVLTSMLASAALAIFMGCRSPLLLFLVCAGTPMLIYWVLTRVFTIYLPAPG